jgi:predicted amidohydrolase YtcJ
MNNSGRIITRAVKLYVDGALGSRGAALSAPYSDQPGADGLLLMTREEAAPLFEKALRDGVQIATHAIGDRGNRLILDWYEEAFNKVPAEERKVANPRWRIEHAQILHVEDIPRFAKLGVIASMQPSHAIGDFYFAPARLGDARLDGAYAWRSLLDAGAIVAGGSDAPVERGDPLIEFYAAVARKDLEGNSGSDWRPEQKVTREEALAMFTSSAAFASFQEADLGTIEVGKKADFTVFSKDIMIVPEAEILTAKPVMTVVDGEIVWRAE